ncbi:MAG: maltose acetyltransferase domain-containing protein, partial [Rhodococcus sp. (in: high G+C Gram-positive bacteria)]
MAVHGSAWCCSRRQPIGSVFCMGENRDRMLRGELYRDSDPDLVASRVSCGQLLDRFNATEADQDGER